MGNLIVNPEETDPPDRTQRSLASEGRWRSIASPVAAVALGFLTGIACFGSAFSSADTGQYIVPGVEPSTLLILVVSSIAIGGLAGKFWLRALFAQLAGLFPGVGFLMLGEPQTTFERLSIPAVLTLVSLVGVFLGSGIVRPRHAA